MPTEIDKELPTFSILIPTFNRRDQLRSAVKSALHQTFTGTNYEVIVCDDGSTDNTHSLIFQFARKSWNPRAPRFMSVSHSENRGKVAARNTLMEAASMDWSIWLDSDDLIHPFYLQNVADYILANPDCKLFTCGAAVYNHKSHTFHVREAFAPKVGEIFKSGRIGSGSFIYQTVDGVKLPESKEAYGGPESFSALVQMEVPEIKELYGQNEDGSWLPFGNPFGCDYVEFFMLTRKYQPIAIPMPLYLQSVRN